MKRLFSMSDIHSAFAHTKKEYSIQDAYDLFCEELERALAISFGARPFPSSIYTQDDSRTYASMKAITMSFATLVLAERLASLRDPIV